MNSIAVSLHKGPFLRFWHIYYYLEIIKYLHWSTKNWTMVIVRWILSTIWLLLWPRSLVIHCVVNRPAFPRHLLLDNPLVTLQTELLICSFIIIASSSLLLLRSIKQENIHNSSFLTLSIRHPLKLKGKKFTCNLFDMKSCCNLSGAT